MNVPKVKLLFEILISHSFEPFHAGYKIIIEVAYKLRNMRFFSDIWHHNRSRFELPEIFL